MAQTEKVIIYTSPGWGACHRAKEFLSDSGIQLEERDASNPDIGKELVDTYGAQSVPVIVIGEEVIMGWGPDDQEKVKSLLNLWFFEPYSHKRTGGPLCSFIEKQGVYRINELILMCPSYTVCVPERFTS